VCLFGRLAISGGTPAGSRKPCVRTYVSGAAVDPGLLRRHRRLEAREAAKTKQTCLSPVLTGAGGSAGAGFLVVDGVENVGRRGQRFSVGAAMIL
jgi:hypothetical protein